METRNLRKTRVGVVIKNKMDKSGHLRIFLKHSGCDLNWYELYPACVNN